MTWRNVKIDFLTYDVLRCKPIMRAALSLCSDRQQLRKLIKHWFAGCLGAVSHLPMTMCGELIPNPLTTAHEAWSIFWSCRLSLDLRVTSFVQRLWSYDPRRYTNSYIIIIIICSPFCAFFHMVCIYIDLILCAFCSNQSIHCISRSFDLTSYFLFQFNLIFKFMLWWSPYAAGM